MPDAKGTAEEVCPVDHKAREAWLQHARAANPDETGPNPRPHPIPQPPTGAPPPPPPPPPTESNSWARSLLSYTPFSGRTPANNPPSPGAAEACPVDHKSREAWLQQARAANASAPHEPSLPPSPPTRAQNPPPPSPYSSWTQTLRSYVPFASSSSPTPEPLSKPTPKSPSPSLDTQREVSTIPRTANSAAYPGNPSTTHAPSNHEQETGADEATGNWIYPSEKMFFDAMKRKGHDSRVADMKTVVPIHNAVNERAWKEIKEWERPYTEGTA